MKPLENIELSVLRVSRSFQEACWNADEVTHHLEQYQPRVEFFDPHCMSARDQADPNLFEALVRDEYALNLFFRVIPIKSRSTHAYEVVATARMAKTWMKEAEDFFFDSVMMDRKVDIEDAKQAIDHVRRFLLDYLPEKFMQLGGDTLFDRVVPHCFWQLPSATFQELLEFEMMGVVIEVDEF